MSKTVRDLKVYQIGLDLLIGIQKLISSLPRSEFREIDQINRAAKSIIANISEGYGKRSYRREFLKYLIIALGSSDEVQAHLDIISVATPANSTLCNELQRRYRNLSVRLLNFIQALRKQNE